MSALISNSQPRLLLLVSSSLSPPQILVSMRANQLLLFVPYFFFFTCLIGGKVAATGAIPKKGSNTTHIQDNRRRYETWPVEPTLTDTKCMRACFGARLRTCLDGVGRPELPATSQQVRHLSVLTMTGGKASHRAIGDFWLCRVACLIVCNKSCAGDKESGPSELDKVPDLPYIHIPPPYVPAG